MLERIKDKIAEIRADAKGRKAAAMNMSQDFSTRVTNFLFRTNKTSEEWLKEVNESRIKRGKKPLKRL